MKKIILPEKAFPHKKKHTICGHVFENGHIIVPNDVADKVVKIFKNFYGATVEDIPDPVEDEQDPDNGQDASLTADSTKGGPETT
jgi:hypothetical protein